MSLYDLQFIWIWFLFIRVHVYVLLFEKHTYAVWLFVHKWSLYSRKYSKLSKNARPFLGHIGYIPNQLLGILQKDKINLLFLIILSMRVWIQINEQTIRHILLRNIFRVIEKRWRRTQTATRARARSQIHLHACLFSILLGALVCTCLLHSFKYSTT